MASPLSWLTLHGEEWRASVRDAAESLLHEYRRENSDRVPVHLHTLALALGVRIVRVRNLEGIARLMPTPQGFDLLLDERIRDPKARTTIAHELAHTLFYSRSSGPPRRLGGRSTTEEHFCFDVGRMLLAPRWLLDHAQLTQVDDAGRVFSALTGRFQLSREVAAAVMLQDHHLACGVGGRWARASGSWKLERGRAYASECLTAAQRRRLREAAAAWLDTRSLAPSGDFRVVPQIEGSGDAAFVVVTHTARCAASRRDTRRT
jgi:hypothetical protein